MKRLAVLAPALLLAPVLSVPAFAKEGEGGLPQLNPEWFASQIFWLVVHFAVLYFIAAKLILPGIRRSLDEREGKIANDLSTANSARMTADKAEEAYAAALAEARAKAQSAREASMAEGTAERARAEQVLADDLARRLAVAEERIAHASAGMQARMRDVAAETAQAIVQKVAGTQVDRSALDAALGRLLDNRLKEVA
jgi:F-type H+-transporting ATPase subunit b